MSASDFQYLKRILKKQKNDIPFSDFAISVHLIEKLCQIQCSTINIIEIKPKICIACNQNIPYNENLYCQCDMHEQCLLKTYRFAYYQLNMEMLNSTYYTIQPSQIKIINCCRCSKNIYESLNLIFKKQKVSLCSHVNCKQQTSEFNSLKYFCRCSQTHQNIHEGCLIMQYAQSQYFHLDQIQCQGCNCFMQFLDGETDKFKQITSFPCFSCQKTQFGFDDIIFYDCYKTCCQNCFYSLIQQLTQIEKYQIIEKTFQSSCNQCGYLCINDRQIQQFKQKEIGRQLFDEIQQQITQQQLHGQKIYTCPGFYFKSKQTGKEERAMAQKYITMKRQAEFDNEIKDEYIKKMNELRQAYEIIECGQIFLVEFQENERIFFCRNCQYRDCRNQECKSPHFNLTCEMFRELQNFKKQNQQNNKMKNVIYKIKYEDKIIIVNQEFYNQLLQNKNNNIELIEEIQNPFFSACNLPFNMFDPKYDREWNKDTPAFRGKIKERKVPYYYPIYKNLLGYGINVEYLYGKQNDLKWLSRNTDEDTFIVGYHGTRSIAAVQGIIANGFQAGAGQAFRSHKCPYTNTEVGSGVYFGASVAVAYGYTSQIQVQNTKYRIIFQCRLNPKTVKGACSWQTPNEYYVVNNPQDIRIYRILLIKE